MAFEKALANDPPGPLQFHLRKNNRIKVKSIYLNSGSKKKTEQNRNTTFLRMWTFIQRLVQEETDIISLYLVH